ncbi:hypothetical protein JD844_001030 [Phrynosoma platyrhinos]|uniref:Large ribosomal subunit protein mL52 n=1 Tax=Phrynosoma platyrhinos TaxID=52577 RepID=A0ABQ7T9I6_PHRPL|nr:hypothetical protein JD844_001030 [Phrynosoma platyrhinos]
MAVCVSRRLGPHLAKTASAVRCFHCSTVDQAGGKWRVRQDGRPAPPMKGYLRRQEKNAELARRVAMISAEMDRGIEKWEAQQREQEQRIQEKRHNRLQPKGNSFPETAK